MIKKKKEPLVSHGHHHLFRRNKVQLCACNAMQELHLPTSKIYNAV